MRALTSIIILTLLNSCSSYIKSLHAEFDKNNNNNVNKLKNWNRYKHNIKTTANNKKNLPLIKKRYIPVEESRKRHKASDFTDNSDGKSLWTNKDGEVTFLYHNNVKKKSGDLIVLLVGVNLKNAITAELRRVFPNNAINAKSKNKNPVVKQKREKTELASVGKKVYDKITTIVIDEINRNHIVIKGRKFLQYQNKKHLVEIQALIGRNDIESNDTVFSDKIIEKNIIVQR